MKSTLRKIAIYVIIALIIILILILFLRPKKVKVHEEDLIGTEIKFTDEKILENLGTVEVNGNELVINSGGSYVLIGSSGDAKITVNAPGKDVELTLNGLELTNKNGPALDVLAGNVTIIVNEGKKAQLSSTGEDLQKPAVIYAQDNLIIKGEGTLVINGQTADVIDANKDLTIESIFMSVNAVKTAFNVTQNVLINNSNITINESETGITGLKVDIKDSFIKMKSRVDGIVATSGAVKVASSDITIQTIVGAIKSSEAISFEGGSLYVYSSGSVVSGATLVTKDTEVVIVSLIESSVTPNIGNNSKMVILNLNEITNKTLEIKTDSGNSDFVYVPDGVNYKSIVIVTNTLQSGVRYHLFVDGQEQKTFVINNQVTRV